MGNTENSDINKKNKVYIIAEAGVNHNGELDKAIKMIAVAKDSGADAVKFQTGLPEEFISRNAEKADYQKKSTSPDQTQLEMIRGIFLPLEDFRILKYECEKVDIEFLSSPFDIKSIDFLEKLGVKRLKIPSGEITNYPYLEHIGKKNMPLILSTGMSNLSEIKEAINIITNSGLKRENITVLQCNTEYPSPIEDANLNVMHTLKKELAVKIGYSDHTSGSESAIASVAIGATIIEKHFTLDKSAQGPDHKASLDPNELKEFVDIIRNTENSLGSFSKIPTQSESKNIPIARKSIVAKKQINKGECFSNKNITTKRPGHGISPMKWNEIIGTIADRNYLEDDLLE